MSVYERLEALNLALPKLAPPVPAFVPFLRSANLIFLAGHLAKLDGQPWIGQLGANLTTEQGKNAARAAAIDLKEAGGWRVTGIMVQAESATAPLPKEYLP